MGSKLSNAQAAASPSAMSQGISMAFGDTEEAARKRKQDEDDAAQAQTSQQATGQEPSAWDTMKSMAGDAASGVKDMASNPGSVWDALSSANDMKKKK